jgi:hypothetical protein
VAVAATVAAGGCGRRGSEAHDLGTQAACACTGMCTYTYIIYVYEYVYNVIHMYERGCTCARRTEREGTRARAPTRVRYRR